MGECSVLVKHSRVAVAAVDGERRAIMGEFDDFGSGPTAGARKVCEVAFALHTARRRSDHQSFMLASSCLGVLDVRICVCRQGVQRATPWHSCGRRRVHPLA